MGFEMQRKNIQPVFCTMGTAYPTNKNIEDSVDMFRRTGCKSIIAVGSGALIDTAKTIRLMAETNVRKISDIAKPLHFRDHVPLLSVATTISPVHSLASGGVLHFEDDVLVRTRCHQPEVSWTKS
jgi:alcohol dehydrogenase class IV